MKDVTIALNKAFQQDGELFQCLKDLGTTSQVTANRLQQLVVFLKGKPLAAKKAHLGGDLIQACSRI